MNTATDQGQLVLPDNLPKRERPSTTLAAPTTDANTALLQVIANAARDPQVDVAKMQALYAMHKDAMADQAKRAFAAAMAEFKRNPPKIVKDKHVNYPNSKGGNTEYDHATLGHVCDQVIACLAAVGISHRWDLAQLDGGMIEVTCVLTHEEGHETRTPLKHGRDDSGGKNSIQGLGSTQSYLERYTLLAATGLAAGMPEDDGRGINDDFEPLTQEEVANIRALITETKADEAALLRIFKADSVPSIARHAYKTVVKMIEARRGR